MTRNSSHIQVVEEASLKAGGPIEDVAIGISNNLKEIGETIITSGKPSHWARECNKKKNAIKNGKL